MKQNKTKMQIKFTSVLTSHMMFLIIQISSISSLKNQFMQSLWKKFQNSETQLNRKNLNKKNFFFHHIDYMQLLMLIKKRLKFIVACSEEICTQENITFIWKNLHILNLYEIWIACRFKYSNQFSCSVILKWVHTGCFALFIKTFSVC